MIATLLDITLSWTTRRPALVLAGAATLTVLSVAALPKLQVDTDVLHLLPRHGPATQAFKRYLSEFGSLDRMYVMFGSSDERPIADFAGPIDDYVARVRALRDVRRVDTGLFGPGRDWSYVADRQLLLLDEGRLENALARFRPDGMRASFDESRTLLSMPSTDAKRLVQQDPLGLLRLLRDRLGAGLPAADATEQGVVSRDGRRRLIVIEPTRPPFDTAFSRRLLSDLAAAESNTQPTRGDDDADGTAGRLRVSYAGGYRVAVETEALVRRETIRNTYQSLVAVLVLLAVGLRSARLVLFGAVPIALASMLVLAGAALTGAKLSAAASGSSAMLFGLGVDAVILLVLRYREEEAAGTPAARVIPCLREPAMSIVLGVVTTAATFLALLLMDFPTLQELGALVGGGILVCGALTIAIVPALLAAAPPPPASRTLTAAALGRLVTAAPRGILAAAVLLTIALAPGVPRVTLVATLDKLRPHTEASDIEAAMTAHFGLTPDVYLVVAQGPELEPLLEDHQRLADLVRTHLPRVPLQSPAALLPPLRVQEARARRIGQEGLDVSRVRDDLAHSAAAGGFREGAFAPFDARLPRLLNPRERVTSDGYRAHGLEDVIAPLVRATAGGFSTATYAFPATRAEADRLGALVPAAGGRLVLTGTPVVNRELEERFWPQFWTAAIVGGVAVVALIALGFHSVSATAFALLPTGLGLVWALGLLGYAGVELDLFSVFGLLTFLGIGVDYGIHVVLRWRAERDSVGVVVRLGPALLLAGGTTLAGFGTLCFSAYPPLRSLGIVLFTTVAGALASSLTVLPALLLRRRA